MVNLDFTGYFDYISEGKHETHCGHVKEFGKILEGMNVNPDKSLPITK
jgi:hypothetical protein